MSSGEVELPSDLVAFVKRDCPTCVLVAPVLAQLARRGELTVFTQDDPTFPAGASVADDDRAWRCRGSYDIETVPTLLRIETAQSRRASSAGSAQEWEASHRGRADSAPIFPSGGPAAARSASSPTQRAELRGALRGRSVARAARRAGARSTTRSKRCYERGWTDGLPVVPPTTRRVLAMLDGTTRASRGTSSPSCRRTWSNARSRRSRSTRCMAGCKPEYLPVVLAAVEAACTDEFNMHGLLATTMPAGPVIIVNGPIRRAIGMNSGINVFGQGNRANSTIGRALQLVIRNVGGGRPGEVDRATFGNPGKVGFCFAEDEEGSPWTPLSADLGMAPGTNTVTLFPGEGPRCIVDQLSRDPECAGAHLRREPANAAPSEARPGLRLHPRRSARSTRASLREAGWDKERLAARLHELLQIPGAELVRGAGGIAEGIPEQSPRRHLAEVPARRHAHRALRWRAPVSSRP